MIARNNGKIVFHDSSISVWEENVDETSMTNDVLAPLIRTMRKLGWSVRADKKVKKHYRTLSKKHRYCRKGDLEAKIRLCGRHLEIKFFQNIANVTNRHGGEYDFDILERMPYLLRLQTKLTLSKLAHHLHDSHGYLIVKKSPGHRDIGPQGITAREFIQINYAESRNLDIATGYPKGADSSYNNKSAEGQTVTHGATVWIKERKQRRWMRGTAYYHINNMWWVVTSPYDIRNVASFDIHLQRPNNLRKQQDHKIHRAKLEKQLLNAIAHMDFERASHLKKKLFGDQPLFRIWNREKQLWYATGDCGYSSDTSRAGLYTREEALRSIAHCEILEMKAIAA